MAVLVPNLADAVVHDDQAKLDSLHVRMLGKQAMPYGVVSGVESECAVTWDSDLIFDVAAGLTMHETGVANTIAAGQVTLSAADATDPRFDLIVVDVSGTKTSRTGTPTALPDPPPLPALTDGDVALAMVYVPAAATALSADHLHDQRVLCMTVPDLLTTTQRDALVSAGRPKGRMFYDSTLNVLSLNVGTGATPEWAQFGAKLTIAGQNDYTANVASEFRLLNKYGSQGIAGSATPLDIQGTLQMYHTVSNAGRSGNLFITAVEGYRNQIIFEGAQRRFQAGGPGGSHTWYPLGAGYYTHQDPDGNDEPMAFSSHGRLENAHPSAAPGGWSHVAWYAVPDYWSNTTRTATSLGGAGGGAITASARYTRERWRVSSVSSISYGTVLLVCASTFEPGRDLPTSQHEYIYVIPDYAGPWGAAGSKTNTDPVTGNPEMDVLRGFWGTNTFAHASGSKLYYVARKPNNQSIQIWFGPDGRGFYPRADGAEPTSNAERGGALIMVNNDTVFNNPVGFADEAAPLWTDSPTPDSIRDDLAGLERASGAGGANVLQAWASAATGGSSGAERPATAFRIVGHPTDDHATALTGSMFYRQDLGKFRLRETSAWRTVVTASDLEGFDVLLDNIGSGSWDGNIGLRLFSETKTFTTTPITMAAILGTYTLSASSDDTTFTARSFSSSILIDDTISRCTGYLVNATYNTTPTADLSFNVYGQNWISAYEDLTSVKIDTLTGKTLNNYHGVLIRPSFSRDNSGTLTVAAYSSFTQNFTTIGAGITVTSAYALWAAGMTVAASGVLTNRYGVKIADITNSGTFTNQYGIDIDQLDNASAINIGIRNGASTVFAPHPLTPNVDGHSFNLDTGTNAWTKMYATLFTFTSNSSTPAGSAAFMNTWILTNGLGIPNAASNGQIAFLENKESVASSNFDAIALQDEDFVSGTDLLLNAHRRVMGPGDGMVAMFRSDPMGKTNKWRELFMVGRRYSMVPMYSMWVKPVMDWAVTDAPLQLAATTTAYFVLVNLPVSMSVFALQINCTNIGTSGNTVKLGVYTEDGVKCFEATSGSIISAIRINFSPTHNQRTTVLPAGNYWVGLVHVNDAGTNPTFSAYTVSAAYTQLGGNRDICCGTATVTAGTLPATFAPQADLTATTTGAWKVHFEGRAS